MRPLLNLLLQAWTRPQQLGLQLARYAEIISSDVGPSADALRLRTLLLALTLLLMTLACTLGGVAALLWAVTPAGAAAQPWLLLAVPAVPLVAALITLTAWRRAARPALWPALKAQLDADVSRLQAPAAAPAESPGQVIAQSAMVTARTVLQPTADAHPWALVGGAAAVGALVVLARPWRGLLRPGLLASLGTQWLLKTLALRALQAGAAPPQEPPHVQPQRQPHVPPHMQPHVPPHVPPQHRP